MFTTRPLWQQLTLASFAPAIFATLFGWFYSESPAGLLHLALFCGGFGYCCGKHFFGADSKRTFAATRTFIGVFAVLCTVLSFVRFGAILSFLERPAWMFQTYNACFGALYVVALYAAFRASFGTHKLLPLLPPALILGPILSYISDLANQYFYDNVRKNPNMVAHAIIDAWWYVAPGLLLTYFIVREAYRIPRLEAESDDYSPSEVQPANQPANQPGNQQGNEPVNPPATAIIPDPLTGKRWMYAAALIPVLLTCFEAFVLNTFTFQLFPKAILFAALYGAAAIHARGGSFKKDFAQWLAFTLLFVAACAVSEGFNSTARTNLVAAIVGGFIAGGFCAGVLCASAQALLSLWIPRRQIYACMLLGALISALASAALAAEYKQTGGHQMGYLPFIIKDSWYVLIGVFLTLHVNLQASAQIVAQLPPRVPPQAAPRPWFLYAGVVCTWVFAALSVYVAAELRKHPCDLCSINMLPYVAGAIFSSAFVIISGVLKFAGNSLTRRDRVLVIAGMLATLAALIVAFNA